MDDHDDQPRVKRFKHQSYNQTLKEVHLPAAHNQAQLDEDISENDSHFHKALDHWRQLNLAPSFIAFANKAESLSASMPLLLHNWKDIIQLWTGAFDTSDDEGLIALLDLLQKMAHDLRITLSPVYPDLLQRLLKLLPRSISAPALTALLETFSTLFKFLLVPSTHTNLIEKTWAILRSTLPNCLAEVQRAMAEVWGSVLRRLKPSAREKTVLMLAENVDGIDDASAWVIVSACKSVSQTLHTTTSSIITPLLMFYLQTDKPEPTYTLIRRVCTALIHHVKNAEQFSPLADIFVAQFSSILKFPDGDSSADIEKIRRMLELLVAPSAVRKGSRLSPTQLASLITGLSTIPIVPALYTGLLKFSVAAFTAADMSLWIGPCRGFLQRIWAMASGSSDKSVLQFSLKLNGCLAELNWGGWKLVALPLLLKVTATQEVQDLDPKGVLELMAVLKRSKKLNAGETDVVWRERVERWTLARLKSWDRRADDVAAAELSDAFALFEFFSSSVTLTILDMINNILATSQDAEKEYTETPSNSSRALGLCLEALKKRNPSEWVDSVDLKMWTMTCVECWGWSQEVLGGLVSLIQIVTVKEPVVPLEAIYPKLQPSLLSHCWQLRLATLRLLGSSLIQSSPNTHEVIRRCLQGEEAPLDVQGVRERILRIGRLGQILNDEDELGAEICSRWLIAQMKVNLRPIWSPATVALSSLSERFGDLVWQTLFSEVQFVGQGRAAQTSPDWMSPVAQDINEVDRIPWEEERTWKDPSAHKLRGVVARWLDEKRALFKLIEAQNSGERFDWHSYEHQLLVALSECSSLAEKHNRELVPHFLALAGPDAVSKMPKQRLTSWLVLFSKFANPKALVMTEFLHTFYVSTLSHPDRSLQSTALRCIFTYKSPSLASYEEKLFALLDETRWRDELTSLDLTLVESRDRSAFFNILIRLLFGIMLEKKGRSRGADRRAAILGTLGGCTEEELGLLVDLMLRPLKSASDVRRDQPFILVSVDASVSRKQQSGFLTLLRDVLKNLGPKLVTYWPALIGTTVDLINNAQQSLTTAVHEDEEAAEGDEDLEDLEESGETGSTTKIIRSIRQLGLKRFADFFRSPERYDFTPYMPACFSSFISPRLAALDRENTQAPSALLELFYSWCIDSTYIKFLVEYDAQVLPKIYDCLVAPNVKPAVISRIFDIIERILASCTTEAEIQDSVVKPHVSLLLRNLSILVQHTKGVASVTSPLAQRQINILSEIAHYCTDSAQASTLLELFTPLLKKPAKFVPEKVKANLLKIIESLLPLISDLSDKSSNAYQATYALLSRLFQSLRSRQSRLSLVSVFLRLSTIDTSLQSLASLVEALNAYSSKHMDEPDFDTRITTFTLLNETQYNVLSSSDWLPLLYNMLHFIQDPLELAIRNNASFALRRFVDLVAASPASDYEVTFNRVLFSGLKNGLRSKNELVRTEVLGVIAYAVLKCNHLASLQEMKVLLADGDEEANFFNNILHVQVHRRSRALRRLAEHCDEGHLRSHTLAEIFVPLVGNYISNTASTDHHLVNEAILTSGRMAKHLAWGAYFGLVQKYLKLSRVKDESERIYVRTLVALLDSFHFPMDEIVEEDDNAVAEDENDGDDATPEDVEVPPRIANVLTARQTAQIADAVNLRLLPDLLNHLEKHDQNTDDNVRIPISIGIVAVAKHLPPASREPQIVRLLTILSQILRSRSQETRDLSREALSRIAVSLGPSYLPLLLRELRAALLRGPQLHVLAYMVHSLLVHITSGSHAASFEDLDDCVNDIAYVSAEVIFGESGKDVQAEGFKTKIREVHSSASKGLDSFAIIAKFVTPPKISSLLAPLKSIMEETASVKVMNLVEEVLRRISGGLNSNKHLIPKELLVLCNTLITQNARFLKQAPARRKQSTKKDVIVQTKRQEAMKVDHFANNSFRFVAFGLELLNTALRRNRFDFHDTDLMARLDAMTVVVGNTLYSTSTPVILLGLRSAAGLSRCPLKSLDKSAPVFTRQILDIIQQVGNTESEVVQIALKSLATMVRDCPSVQVTETDLVYLLGLLAPDLEDPDRQAAVFSMLRTIVARKFVVPEIYDLMDKVSEIMVTSQSTQVQELCRGVLLQFLLDYPQGKGRLRKQMTFFAKNLSYVFESGRKSVMEILSAVINKFEVNLVYDYSDLLFIALAMVIANDDSAKCREMAAVLIKSLFTRLDDNRRKLIFSHLHSWASQQSQPQLARVSSQIYGFVVDVLETDSLPHMTIILEDLNSALVRSASNLSEAEAHEADDSSIQIDLDWQIPYYALTVLTKILRFFPQFATQEERVRWSLIVSHLLFPHAWVRTAACRLLGTLFNTFPPGPPAARYPDTHPLSNSGMRDVAQRMCSQLKSENLDEALGLQVVKNLFYIGKCFYAMPALEASLQDNFDAVDKERETNIAEELKQKNPLPWLFSKLSYQIKSAHISRRNRTFQSANWAQQPLSVLRWFAAMASHMDATRLENFLVHILTPVYRILEDDTIKDAHIDELKTVATELQDLLQSKVGTTQFSTTYNQIRQGVVGIRRERKASQATQAVANPEAAARRKAQRNAIKKESRKRKTISFSERQGKLKRRRAEG